MLFFVDSMNNFLKKTAWDLGSVDGSIFLDSPFKQEYVKIVIFILVAIFLCILLILVGYTMSRELNDVHFYIVSILFLIFDVEIALLFPWVIGLSDTSYTGFLTIMVFLIFLTVGFIMLNFVNYQIAFFKKLLPNYLRNQPSKNFEIELETVTKSFQFVCFWLKNHFLSQQSHLNDIHVVNLSAKKKKFSLYSTSSTKFKFNSTYIVFTSNYNSIASLDNFVSSIVRAFPHWDWIPEEGQWNFLYAGVLYIILVLGLSFIMYFWSYEKIDGTSVFIPQLIIISLIFLVDIVRHFQKIFGLKSEKLVLDRLRAGLVITESVFYIFLDCFRANLIFWSEWQLLYFTTWIRGFWFWKYLAIVFQYLKNKFTNSFVWDHFEPGISGLKSKINHLPRNFWKIISLFLVIFWLLNYALVIRTAFSVALFLVFIKICLNSSLKKPCGWLARSQRFQLNIIMAFVYMHYLIWLYNGCNLEFGSFDYDYSNLMLAFSYFTLFWSYQTPDGNYIFVPQLLLGIIKNLIRVFLWLWQITEWFLNTTDMPFPGFPKDVTGWLHKVDIFFANMSDDLRIVQQKAYLDFFRKTQKFTNWITGWVSALYEFLFGKIRISLTIEQERYVKNTLRLTSLFFFILWVCL